MELTQNNLQAPYARNPVISCISALVDFIFLGWRYLVLICFFIKVLLQSTWLISYFFRVQSRSV